MITHSLCGVNIKHKIKLKLQNLPTAPVSHRSSYNNHKEAAEKTIKGCFHYIYPSMFQITNEIMLYHIIRAEISR